MTRNKNVAVCKNEQFWTRTDIFQYISQNETFTLKNTQNHECFGLYKYFCTSGRTYRRINLQSRSDDRLGDDPTVIRRPHAHRVKDSEISSTSGAAENSRLASAAIQQPNIRQPQFSYSAKLIQLHVLQNLERAENLT